MAKCAVSVEKPVCSAGKGTSWVDEELKTLLSIWTEANIQQELDRTVRNKSIFEKIAKRLNFAKCFHLQKAAKQLEDAWFNKE